MPQGLLLLPLLGGFLFLHLSHVFRFKAQRYDGYRLILASAGWGVILLSSGRLLVLSFSAIPILNGWAERIWFTLCPFQHSDACAWSFVLGPLLAKYVVNRMYDIEKAKDRQLDNDRQADAFTRLLHVATRQNRLISVTLDSRKWYVGYVAEAPNLNPEEKYFRILPLVSGYRDKDTLETFRTTFYKGLTETARTGDFVVTLPIADVKTANFFDPDAYEHYFAEEDEDGGNNQAFVNDEQVTQSSRPDGPTDDLPSFSLIHSEDNVQFEYDRQRNVR